MSERDVPAWIPSPRFEDAVLYAIRTHALQARKGGTIPYLAHLFAVASLVMEDGGSEDEAIAALLHDAAEDQGGEPRLQDIEAHFGSNVTAIVLGCSDTLEVPKPPWEQRKRDYVAHLRSADPGVIQVSVADKLHNARSMAADHAILARSCGRASTRPAMRRPRTTGNLRRLSCAGRRRPDGRAALCHRRGALRLMSDGEIPEIPGTEGAIDGWWTPVIEDKTQLHHEEINGTWRSVFGGFGLDGELVLMARDRGAAPRAVWGRDEYEFWATVAPGQKDALLLALIAERFAGQGDAVDRFRGWLTAHGIPHEFHNWM